MKSWLWKTLGILSVLIVTCYVGLSFVAPRVLLKLSRNNMSSSAADYGMRYDPLLVVSEDSLDLRGEMIYSFNTNVGDEIPNHSLIVLHPIKATVKEAYWAVKPLITTDINFIVFDSRGHGKSEGFEYSMGVRETDDISKIMDMVLEMHPDHSFGIYGKGNAGNIALRAMSQDKRLQYGIIEDYYSDPVQQLSAINYDDVLFDAHFIHKHILKKILSYLDLSEQDINIQLNKITQPLLFLTSEYTNHELDLVYEEVCSTDKVQFKIDTKNEFNAKNQDAAKSITECLKEFISLYSVLAREYIKEQVFQPS